MPDEIDWSKPKPLATPIEQLGAAAPVDRDWSKPYSPAEDSSDASRTVIGRREFKKKTGQKPLPASSLNAQDYVSEPHPEVAIPALLGTAAGAATDGLGSRLGWSMGRMLAARLLANSAANFGSDAIVNPEYVKNNPGNAALGAGINAAGGEGVGQILGAAGGKIRDAFLRKQFPINRTPEDLDLLKTAPPDLPYTVGQAQGKPNSILRENSYNSEGKINVVKGQDAYEKPRSDFFLHSDTEGLINEAARMSKQNSAGMKGIQKEAYGNFDSARDKLPPTVVPGKPYTVTGNVIDPNTGQPVQVTKQGPATLIKNPVDLTTTNPTVDQMLDDLDKKYPQSKMVNDQLNPIYRELEYVKSQQGTPVSYDKIKQLHDSINDFLSKSQSADWQHQYGSQYKGANGLLGNLNRRIGNDIDSSIQNWGGNLGELHEKAKNSYITRMNSIDPKMAQDLLNKGIDPEIGYRKVLDSAFSSVDKLRQAKSISGDVQGIAEMGMQRATEKGLDPTTGKIDAGKILNEVQKPENADIYREAIPSSQRGNFTEFWKRMNAIKGSDTEAEMMQNVMSYQKGKMALSLPVAAGAAFTLGHSLPVSAASAPAGVLGILRIQKYIGKMMTNPQVARALVEGTKIPSSSPAAKRASQIILRSLAGVSGLEMQDMVTKNAPPIPIEINNDGKIILPSGR